MTFREIKDDAGTTYRAANVVPTSEYLALLKNPPDSLQRACEIVSKSVIGQHPEMTPERVAELFTPSALLAAVVVVGVGAFGRLAAPGILAN